MRQINLVNRSTVVTPADFHACVGALQIQVARDFAKVWSSALAVVVTALPDQGTAHEQIIVLDDSDQAGALGYHDITPGDVPIGYCFAKTTIAAGDHWQATLSHELLEQIVDPFCCTVADSVWLGKPAALPLETCDAVENDEYVINGVPVSNFVSPYWFLPGPLTPARKVDFLGKLSQPLTLSPGGYMSYSTDLVNWQQTFGRTTPAHQRTAERYSRRDRRVKRKHSLAA